VFYTGVVRKGRASRTAEQNALFRALESSRPEGARLFEDPLARAFLRTPLSWVERGARAQRIHDFVTSTIDRRWPGVRTSVVARTRLIDETIATVVDADTPQVVLLGAGFDSRAVRLPELSRARVFEVDHPDTQAAKRRVLQRELGALPANIRFVACNFDEQDLESVMRAAGYDRTLRSFILWEGVSNYLSPGAVDTTLRWCARAAPGSRLLFTYVHRDVLTRPELFVGSQRLYASLARAGEKLTWGIVPEGLRVYLAERGLTLQSDLGASEYRLRYYGDAARQIRGHEFYRVALAKVG
jgi:methyltransferase (TIGR00027 family)